MVDAGMRCLWACGWMHQSVRMVVASFLVEYLGVSWVEGARWFHNTLVDADVAINSMMWQVHVPPRRQKMRLQNIFCCAS